MIQMNLLNRNRLTDLEKEIMVTSGEWGGIVREFGIHMYLHMF